MNPVNSANQTVFLVDDDPAVRDSLQWLLESVQKRVEAFASPLELLDRLHRNEPGCLILDLRLPGMSGLDLHDRLLNKGIDLPAIMITGHGDVSAAVRALKGGMIDFIEKPFSDQLLLDRVQEALDLDRERRELMLAQHDVSLRVQRLTPREKEVMALVVQGKLNKQIAAELGLSHKTIEVHRAHVMEKMDAQSLAELVRMAVTLEEKQVAISP